VFLFGLITHCEYVLFQVTNKVGNFWENVTSTYTVNLSKFELPGCKRVQFVCIDPVYAWITCCNALHKRGIPLHWKPRTLHHPVTGDEVYGAGIQYSKLLRSACETLGTHGNVALFNINWDGGGTGFGSRSCTPIHVQVMNTNSASTLTVSLIGYIPHIAVPEGYREQNNYKAARQRTCSAGSSTNHLVRLRSFICSSTISISSST